LKYAHQIDINKDTIYFEFGIEMDQIQKLQWLQLNRVPIGKVEEINYVLINLTYALKGIPTNHAPNNSLFLFSTLDLAMFQKYNPHLLLVPWLSLTD